MRAALIEQTHGEATAFFDPTFTYRYRLTWHWGAGPRVTFIMLNPSTATEQQSDPTIRRVWQFARDNWAPGRLDVVNLYALRATDPRLWVRHPDPIGPDNDELMLKNAAMPTSSSPRGAGTGGHVAGKSTKASPTPASPCTCCASTETAHPPIRSICLRTPPHTDGWSERRRRRVSQAECVGRRR